MGVEASVQAVCDLALRFGENRKGKEEQMVFTYIYARFRFVLIKANFRVVLLELRY